VTAAEDAGPWSFSAVCASGHLSRMYAGLPDETGRRVISFAGEAGACPECGLPRSITTEVIAPSGDTTGAADTAAIEEALRWLPDTVHDGPMRYTEGQRTQIAADGAGKTVQSLQWEGDGAYWSMIFTDGTEMSFRFMAEIAG
jgi:hypothetical protein